MKGPRLTEAEKISQLEGHIAKLDKDIRGNQQELLTSKKLSEIKNLKDRIKALLAERHRVEVKLLKLTQLNLW